MSSVKIKDFVYKNINGAIYFASGKNSDWGNMNNKFYFDGITPFTTLFNYKEIETLENKLKEEYDK